MQFGPICGAGNDNLTLAKRVNASLMIRGKLQRCLIYLKQMGVTAYGPRQ